jgi:hypothetical protein
MQPRHGGQNSQACATSRLISTAIASRARLSAPFALRGHAYLQTVVQWPSWQTRCRTQVAAAAAGAALLG